MEIFADDYLKDGSFSIPFQKMVKDLKNGDTLSFSKREYHFHKDLSPFKIIHMTNTDSFANPQKYFGMLFKNLNNITINGNGAVFVIHGDMCALSMLNCSNIKLNNFTITYACPNSVEMKVVGKSENSIIYQIPYDTQWELINNDILFYEKSPFNGKNYWSFKNDENSWCCVYHSCDLKTVYRIGHEKSPFFQKVKAQKISSDTVKIEYKSVPEYKIGDRIAMLTNKNRNTCGIFFSECSGVESKDICVNYLAGFGWLSQMCADISFENVIFKAKENHIVTSFADLIHVCGCKGKVRIKNCHFEHAHDDAINIHGSFLRFVKQIDDYTAKFEFVHNQQGGYSNFFIGNKVKFYYRTSLQEFTKIYTVKNVFDEIENKTVTLEFCEKLPNEINDRKFDESNVVIENKTYCPDVEICDCCFTAIPTRGILCTTSGKVRIHNNKFTDCQMANIFISNDADEWYESGPVSDVKIYENEFNMTNSQYDNCPGILIEPIVLGKTITKPIHKNINIYKNKFIVKRDIPIRAIGVENMKIYSNEFVSLDEIQLRCCKNTDIR